MQRNERWVVTKKRKKLSPHHFSKGATSVLDTAANLFKTGAEYNGKQKPVRQLAYLAIVTIAIMGQEQAITQTLFKCNLSTPSTRSGTLYTGQGRGPASSELYLHKMQRRT
jgi:hypothetical protein